ncbi:MAG: MarR family winged helix-turn-helix transcriptional regulator [Acidimicrobiales bacterium]
MTTSNTALADKTAHTDRANPPDTPSPTHKAGASDNQDPAGDTVAGIEGAMQSVARITTLMRSHEKMVSRAGIHLDRAGAVLLRELTYCDCSLRLTDLAYRLGIDGPGVTRKVQQLERQGLVSRTHDPEDKRAYRLEVTPAGRTTIDRLLAAKREWLGEVLTNWSEKDRARFAGLLERFAHDIAVSQDLESSHQPATTGTPL